MIGCCFNSIYVGQQAVFNMSFIYIYILHTPVHIYYPPILVCFSCYDIILLATDIDTAHLNHNDMHAIISYI